MTNDMTDLVRALVENLNGPTDEWRDWTALAMILEFGDDGFYSAHGYAYSEGGVIAAVACDPWVVRDAVKAFTDSRYSPGEALPVKVLVQFDRTSGRYNVEFEDTDETRWKVTPRTFRTLREELRPRFN